MTERTPEVKSDWRVPTVISIKFLSDEKAGIEESVYNRRTFSWKIKSLWSPHSYREKKTKLGFWFLHIKPNVVNLFFNHNWLIFFEKFDG